MASDAAVWELFEDAVRGFFFEKHLPGRQADEWTEEIAMIAKEHGLRPVPKDSTVVPTDALLGVLAWAAEVDYMTEEGRSDMSKAAAAAGLDPATLTMYRLMRPPRG